MRRLAVASIVLASFGFAACGHDSKPVKTSNSARTDGGATTTSLGSADASSAAAAAAAAKAGQAAQSSASAAAVRGLGPCGVPPTTTNNPYGTPPGGAFAKPKNDFPITLTVKPGKADHGAKVHLAVKVVSTQKIVIVLVANFLDQKDHGIVLTKFADSTGKASWDVTVPNEAPLGLGRFVASASTRDNQSALAVEPFTVTGPGCR